MVIVSFFLFKGIKFAPSQKNGVNIFITLALYSSLWSRGNDIKDRNFNVFFSFANLNLYK
jgi:hypothetical protein